MINIELEQEIIHKISNIYRPRWISLKQEWKDYLLQRWDDCNDIKESYLRIKNNITEIPKCPICGNNCLYWGAINLVYAKTCGNSHCVGKLRTQSSNNTKIQRYGTIGYNNSEKAKQTKLKKYGDPNYNNREKQKQTCLKRYGTLSYTQTDECKNKIRKTCLERYGVINGGCSQQALEKMKNTFKEKYGVEYSWQIPEVSDKSKQTKLERYGNANFVNTEKMKQTCLERYGVDNGFKTEMAQTKYRKTCLEKYGVDHNWKIKGEHDLTHTPEALEKKKQTSLKNWGVEHPHQSSKIIDKVYNTMKLHGTINSSKMEDESYKLLKEKYPDIIRQYKSNVYPFSCDFYIPSLDLYIECQYGQFHHKRPYLCTEQDLKDIEILKEKANKIHLKTGKNKSRYDVEIETWSIRDVNKRNIAKQNKLNYIEFWNINDCKNWINKGEIS